MGALVQCPLLFITGDSDPLVPTSVVDSLGSEMAKRTAPAAVEFQVYKSAGHAFAHHPQSDQDRVDSEKAMTDALQWLHRYL